MPVAATLLSALCFGLAFPPAALWPLGWVALVPLFRAIRGGRPAKTIGLAILWTVAAAWSIGDWYPRAVTRYYAQPAPIGAAVFLGTSFLTAAPFHAAFALVYRPTGGTGSGRKEGARPPSDVMTPPPRKGR